MRELYYSLVDCKFFLFGLVAATSVAMAEVHDESGPPSFFVQPGPELPEFKTAKGCYRVSITVDGVNTFPRKGTPVRCGVPLPLGLLRSADQLRLLDSQDREVFVQVQPTGYWHEGSLRWVLLDFLATERQYQVEIGSLVTRKPHDTPLSVETSSELITIVTGPMKLVLSRQQFKFPGQIWLDNNVDSRFTDDEKLTDGGELFVRLDGELAGSFVGSRCGEIESWVVTEGPLRATVRLAGRYVDEKDSKANYWVVYLHFYAGRSCIEVNHSFINSVDIRRTQTLNLGIELPIPRLAQATVSIGTDGEVVQAPAKGRSIAGLQINAVEKAPPKFDQFQPEFAVAVDGNTTATKTKSDGWIMAQTANDVVGVGLRDIWKRYPKQLQVDGKAGKIRVYLQPEMDMPFDWFNGVDPKLVASTGAPWQAFGDDGIALTDDLILEFGFDLETLRTDLEAFCAIPNAYADPHWLEATKAIGCIAARDPKSMPEIESQLDRLVEWLYRHQNDWFHWYGSIDYGGIQTHYQPKFGHWSNLTERFGWLNYEADCHAGLAQYYLRSGNRKAFELLRSLCRHAADVDTKQLGDNAGLGRRHWALHFGSRGDWAHTMLFGPTLYYQATGDDRVGEMIHSVGELVLRADPDGGRTRDTHNQLRCASWLFALTADPRYRRHVQAQMQSTIALQQPWGGWGYPLHTNEYLLYAANLYDRLIGGQFVRQAIARNMDLQLDYFKLEHLRDYRLSEYISQNVYVGLQHAYLATGTPKYLWFGLRDLSLVRYQQLYERYHPVQRFPRTNHWYLCPAGQLRPDSFASMHSFGRLTSKIPHFLYAVKQAGLTDYSQRIDTSIEGTFEPFAAPTREAEPGSFSSLKLASLANLAPMAVDPFGYIGKRPREQEAAIGPKDYNLKGLPWGGTVVFGNVPFTLGRADTPKAKALICLEKAESVVIPVGLAADRVHFLGQVLADGDFEYGQPAGRYVFEFEDGRKKTVEWKNLVNCEDWRMRHYSLDAPLALTWAPRAFDDAGEESWWLEYLRHLNTFSFDCEGRTLKRIRFEAGSSTYRPMLLAATVELAKPRGQANRVFSAVFGTSRRDAASQRAVVKLDGKLSETQECLTSQPEAGPCKLTIPLPPGSYRVELLLDASGPLSMDINIGDKRALSQCHLIGSWQTGTYPQRIAFNVDHPSDQLELTLVASRGHQLYDGQGGGQGGVAWGLGWTWDPESKRWFGPKSNEFKTRFGPVWRLHELKVYPRPS